MTPAGLLFVILGLGLIGWQAGKRSVAIAGEMRPGDTLADRALLIAGAVMLPALAFLLWWSFAVPSLVTDAVLASPAAATLPGSPFERASILADARRLASGHAPLTANAVASTLAPAYARAIRHASWVASIIVMVIVAGGGLAGWRRAARGPAARPLIERVGRITLLLAALAAILATVAITAMLIWGGAQFFAQVPLPRFLLGTHWAAQEIDAADPAATLGALPLFWGTFLIGGVIAMAIAVPVGLLAAIWLDRYAGARRRARIKPALELLAAVPTVVYGYFAALTVAPAVRDLGLALGLPHPSAESALAAGLVMGMMLVPLVAALTDDALRAVPIALVEGSLALGATTYETVRGVLLPAALPGIAAGVLLALSRAVGETMIVVMAASGIATITADPFAPATTVTRQIVDLLTGEAGVADLRTETALALGLTLFVATLALNLAALALVRRHREAYD